MFVVENNSVWGNFFFFFFQKKKLSGASSLLETTGRNLLGTTSIGILHRFALQQIYEHIINQSAFKLWLQSQLTSKQHISMKGLKGTGHLNTSLKGTTLLTMIKTKNISTQLRKKIVEAHDKGEDYSEISQHFTVLKTTARSIIVKETNQDTVVSTRFLKLQLGLRANLPEEPLYSKNGTSQPD